jgi:glycylpeptide N-tetradecanoyltransferase
MKKEDIKETYELFKTQNKKYKVSPNYTIEEFEYWFLPKPKMIYSYIVECENKITDFISFYSVPTTVIDNKLHDELSEAYLYYYATNNLQELMSDILVLSKKVFYFFLFLGGV